MSYTIDSPITGKPSGTLAEALGWMDIKAGPETEYATELWRLATLVGIDPVLLFSQAAHETADFSSAWWQYRKNPAGIGITGDPEQNDDSQIWKNGTDAARAHVVHMSAYLPDKIENDKHLDPFVALDNRFLAVVAAGYDGTVRTLNDLTGKWATDPRYAEKIAAKANAIFPNRQEAQLVTKHETVIPGLPGGPLVTDYPISLTFLLPSSQTINRPGIKAKLPRVDVQHGNGNPNAFAASDAQWLRNGAKNDQGQPTQTSFHATADDNGVFICVPADEVTWQAADGAGPGNMSGFSCEMSEHAIYRQDMSRLRKNIYVNADFMGRVAARLDIAEPGQHWDYNYESVDRHNCPNILRTMSIDGVPCWTIYVNQWNVSKIQELANMNGDGPATPTAAPIWWTPGDVGPQKRESDGHMALSMLGEVTAKKDVVIRVTANGKAPAIRTMKQGEHARIAGTTRAPDKAGTRWVFIETAPNSNEWGRARYSSFNERFPTL